MNIASQHSPFRRLHRRAILLLVVHAAIFSLAYFLAFFIRNDFSFSDWTPVFLATVGGVVTVKLVVFYLLGHMHASWSRVAFGDLTSLLWAATLSTLVLVAIDSFAISTGWLPVPRVRRSVILLDWATAVLAIGGIRTLYRSIREELRPLFSRRPARIALIVGANQAGELIARNLMAASQNPYYVVGFLDEDRSLKNSRVAGIEVLGTLEQAGAEVARRRVDDVIVQSGMLRGKAFRKLLAECTAAGATVKVLPDIDELLAGEQAPTHVRLRSVEIKDLLRREPVRLDDAAIMALIEGRTVMVTGAGGSIGAEICRQVLRYSPRRLLLVERSENALFALEQEFSRLDPRPSFEPLIGDVTDARRMEQIFATFQPEVVFHAAAHKHVPMMEWNPAEAIKNNVLGTRRLAQLADRHGVREFVSISTDKAVNPTSVMGCSKLLAERFVQAMSHESRTKFIVVRFGNVLASNGSVVPTFQEQIRRGGPITVTHPDIERYFMTIPEASQLVLQAASQGTGGEIFVLDMGESVKIVDLARDLIALSGLDQDDIEIIYTGLRPGEKLFEELYCDGERRVSTKHPKVFCAMHRPTDLAAMESLVDELAETVDDRPDVIRARLRELVPDYAAATEGPPARSPAEKGWQSRAL
jgi:FlaA1/EpsC-like NDP-sugar epimerase